MVDPAGSALVGTLVAGRYQVIKRLGAGGMGAVFLAEQQPLQRKVALKLLGQASDAEAHERFLREARAASKLNHPNIATVYDFGSSDAGPYLAMELIEGPTLRAIMPRGTPMPWREAVAWVSQLARGLAAAHREGIVHRDIKPENVMVQRSDSGQLVKILDFGLANVVAEHAASLTQTGQVMGTAAYISPEQLNGLNTDVRSDLYALGVIFYEMLVGHHPFDCKTPVAFAIAHATQKVPAMATQLPELPVELSALVDRLLDKVPDNRPDDGAAVVQLLDALLQAHKPVNAKTESTLLPRVSDQAPTKHVALVFTDIEGSSSMWDRVPTAMRIALDMHNAIMREALHLTGGYEVKTQGDSFMIAFASEQGALRWCLQVQRTLRDAEWPEELGAPHLARTDGDPHSRIPALRVRMGVHAGAPECRRDPITGRMDYFGPMVNRAARISSAAYGGQILVGAQVAEALQGQLAGLGARAESKGEHQLRGLDEPEHLVEIIDEEGPVRHFPSPRSFTEIVRTNIAKDKSVFVGRSDECGQIVDLFRTGTRLISLLGPGGTGKTRLARVVALEMLLDPSGPEQAWFCDLSAAADGATLITQVASVLSIPLVGGGSVGDGAARVGRSLAKRGAVLLILDNFEQLVTATAETVSLWLENAPELTILVTSRQVLNVEGEQRLELEALDVGTGVDLFKARVKELGRPLAADEQTLRELVIKLDGMPLAIELAASRVGLLSPKQILERLHNRFELLRGTRNDGNRRQATLRGAIDWSWEMLTPIEKEALAQLGVFVEGFDVEAAEQILDLSMHEPASFVLDVIQALKEKSLLRTATDQEEELRISMLRSILDYCVEKLEATPDAGAGVRARHAEYFLREGKRYARAVKTRAGRAAIRWLAANRQNLMAVKERYRLEEPSWAANAILALQPLLAEREQGHLHRQLLDEAIELSRAAGCDHSAAQALLFRADLEQESGNAEQALELITEAQEILSGELRDPALAILAKTRAGRILHRMGKVEESCRVFDEVEPQAKALGAQDLLALILSERGLLTLVSGLPDHGYFVTAARLARRSGDRTLEGRILGNQGVQHMLRGELA